MSTILFGFVIFFCWGSMQEQMNRGRCIFLAVLFFIPAWMFFLKGN